jgi:hypothetical protein
MNPSAAPAPAAPLLFSWDAPDQRTLVLTGFLVASALAHAICFYVFQIVYPPTLSLLAPPARVSVISPNTEEGRSLLRWIEAEDPALASITFQSPKAKTYALPKVEHIPSYSGYEPALKKPPPLVVDLRIPSAQPPGAVPTVRARPALTTPVMPTLVLFSEPIKALGPPSFPSTKFGASANEPPESARFQIGVSAQGEVRYCFPLNSSGDASLDEQARNHLILTRFPARPASSPGAEAGLIWGTATVQWGNDLAPSPSTPPEKSRP